MLLLLVTRNPLPLTGLSLNPLDGGQLFHNLFLPDRDILSIIFILLSIVLVSWYAFENKNWYLLIISYSLFARLIFRGSASKLRKRLDALEIDYHKSYSELSDGQYWAIRGELRYHSYSPGWLRPPFPSS